MRGFFPRTLLLLFPLLICIPSSAEQAPAVRIGVAVMRSGTDKVSVIAARDRLIKALNHQKLGKKREIVIEAIALDEAKGPPAFAEAKAKNCQWVIFSHLTDLTTSERGESANFTLGGVTQVPVITAKVAYQVARVSDSAEIAIGSATGEDSTSIPEAVFQAISHLVPQAVGEMRKGGNIPHRELASDNSAGAGSAPLSFEAQSIGPDYCKWLPENLVHAEALRGVCEYAMSLQQKMPNFICDQQTSRYSGENQVPRDLITALVRYEDGSESYSEIKLNGKPAPSAVTDAPGLWSTGQFGSNLRAIFDLHNKPLFEFEGENKLGERAAWVFRYQIIHQNDPLWRLRTEDEMVAPPYSGELWVDQKDGALLRFRAVAKDIPVSFPTQSAELMTDYDNVRFSDGTSFLLPATAVVATQFRGEEPTRNVLQFSNCHRFRAKSRMVLDVAGSTTGTSAGDVSADAADAERAREESENIYAILREQAVREDAARLESEQILDLNAVNFAAIQRIAARERERRKNLQLALANAKRAVQLTAGASSTAVGGGDTPETVFKMTVKLVPVSVVLRDATGQVVRDRKKEDFLLFDNGKPQAITSFSVEDSQSETANRTQAPMPGQVNSAEVVNKSTGTVLPARSLAYVFDDIHMTFADLASAREAAARHLSAMPGTDLVAIFTTSGRTGAISRQIDSNFRPS